MHYPDKSYTNYPMRKLEPPSGRVLYLPENLQVPPVLTVLLDQLYMPYVLRCGLNILYRGKGRRDTHAHDVYHCLIYTRGSGKAQIGAELVQVQRGSLVLVGPGERHSFELSPSEDACYTEVTFELKNAEGGLAHASWSEILERWSGCPVSIKKPMTNVPEEMVQDLERIISGMVQVCHGMPKDFTYRTQCTLFTLYTLLCDAFRELPEEDLADDALQQVYQRVVQDTVGKWSLRTLADTVQLSSNYLSRAFKARFGITPMTLQLKTRLRAAEVLLRTTNTPIKAVAFETGFSNQQYFTRMLKKHTGQTPARIRNRRRDPIRKA